MQRYEATKSTLAGVDRRATDVLSRLTKQTTNHIKTYTRSATTLDIFVLFNDSSHHDQAHRQLYTEYDSLRRTDWCK